MRKQIKGSLCLLLCTIIWGSAFVAQSVGMDKVGPFTFLAVRCLLATLALLPVILFRARGHLRKALTDPKLWRSGLLCGSILFVASGLQQLGLIYTTAGKGGFITAMYIVLVPMLGLVLHRKPPKIAFFSVGVAAVGLYLISGAGMSAINIGDILMLCCAGAFAVQITVIDRVAGELDSILLNAVQSLVCAALSAVLMWTTETPDIQSIGSCWFPLFYAGVLSMGVAYTLQIMGQKVLDPTTASLFMSLESVFAALSGWLILHERMTGPELLGCGLVFAAVIVSQIPEKAHK